MTLQWVFPAYPLLLTAPFGSALVGAAIGQNGPHYLNGPAITFASVTVQGAGFLIAFMICSAFIYRLMTQKLPRDIQRPGIVSIRISSTLQTWLTRSQCISIGVWFFLISVGSLWEYLNPDHKLPLQVTWFTFVFPNTALVTATIQLSNALDNRSLAVLGCVIAAALILVWLLVFERITRGVYMKELLWPKGED
jgi:tellurite resistance protein TehA-like permease